MKRFGNVVKVLTTVILFVISGFHPEIAGAAESAILSKLTSVSTISSTVPSNGDVNPYGVAIVPATKGNLKEGHILVSNFNNVSNQQGTGSTIVDIAPDGSVSLFAHITEESLPDSCPGGVGLTTALVALRSGWVIVGSLPTADGTSATAQDGCLIVLDSTGNPVETFFGSMISGPWDMTAYETKNDVQLFFSNVLIETVKAGGQAVNKGNIVRINLDITGDMPEIESMTVIGSGFSERTDPAALVIGPTGLGLGPGSDPVLYVADTLNNRIAVIRDARHRTTSAGTGSTLSSGGSLNGPLGLTVTTNGHILTVNGNDGLITEMTARGRQIAKKQLDNTGTPPGAGTLFGLAFDPHKKLFFVDNGTNTLNVLQ